MPPRILVIDDDPIIHEVFEEILNPPPSAEEEALNAAAALLGSAPGAVRNRYALDHAHSGREGCECIERSVAEDAPYAAAFVDVRMEPGWCGFDIIPRIREVDPDLQIVVCTAYGDPEESEWERIGFADSTFLLKKPFEQGEVRRFAKALVARRQSLSKMRAQLARYAVEMSELKDWSR